MTEKKLYTCDICKTDYANKADAQKCEKEHCKCAGITDFRIHAHQKYPHKIEVTFSDGTKHWYRQQLGELNNDITYFYGATLYGRDKEDVLRISKVKWSEKLHPTYATNLNRVKDYITGM